MRAITFPGLLYSSRLDPCRQVWHVHTLLFHPGARTPLTSGCRTRSLICDVRPALTEVWGGEAGWIVITRVETRSVRKYNSRWIPFVRIVPRWRSPDRRACTFPPMFLTIAGGSVSSNAVASHFVYTAPSARTALRVHNLTRNTVA